MSKEDLDSEVKIRLVERRPSKKHTDAEESEPQKEKVQLKKELGLLDGAGIIIGVIIGSGIFISPTGVVRYAGSVGVSLIVWVLAGIISTLGAMCYAELGTMIPKSGADYEYIREVYGDLPSFLYLWMMMLIVGPTRGAIISMTFSNYILQPFFSNCPSPPLLAIKLVAICIISLLTWINCRNVKAVTKIQDVFTIIKLLALVIIIITGFVHLAMGNVENYREPFKGSSWAVGEIATAFYQGLFSYAGWNYLNYVVEELKDPYVNLPKAILISLPTVTIIYTLTNIAYFAVLSPAEILASSAVAVTFAERMFGYMAWIISFFVACSTFGSLNGGIFATSRLFFAGARRGHLPSSIALINVKASTPVLAIVFLGGLSIAMTLFSNIYALITYAVFSESVFILLCTTELLWLRYKEPNRTRPIKIWTGYPIIFFIVCVFLVILPVVENPMEIGIALSIILSGIPVYFIFVKGTAKSTKIKLFLENVNRQLQILTVSLPEEKDD